MDTNHQPIHDADLSALYQYWMQQAGDRMMPARSDIDPMHIPDLLPKIGLVDVSSGNGVRYRFRLIGTKLVELSGCDFTGQPFNALPSQVHRDYYYDLYNSCVQNARPIFSDIEITLHQENDVLEPRVQYGMDHLLLPLSTKDGSIDIILFSCKLQSPPTPELLRTLETRRILTIDERQRHIL